MDIRELFKRIDVIKEAIMIDLDTLTPRELSNYAVHLSSINDSLSAEFAKAERAYAQKWQEIRKEMAIVRDADMAARNTEEYKIKRELEARIKSVAELVNALKKHGTMLELEARNQQ